MKLGGMFMAIHLLLVETGVSEHLRLDGNALEVSIHYTLSPGLRYSQVNMETPWVVLCFIPFDQDEQSGH